MSCEQILFKRLREHGFRLTPQREMVLSVMHQMDNFATAEQIYEAVRVLSSSVDISTVYRTLDLFQEFNVIAAIDTGDGQRRYRLTDADSSHFHLVCRSCGEVTEVDWKHTQFIAAYLEEHSDFEAELSHLSIPGLCCECRVACGERPS